MTPMSQLSKELQDQLLDEFQSSGDSCRQFCQNKGISYQSFKNLTYRTKSKTKNLKTKAHKFVPVVIEESIAKTEGSEIRIIFKNGVTLVISNDFKEELLLRLIRVLG